MATIFAVFLIVFGVIGIFEFSSRSVYGKFLTDEEIMDFIKDLSPFELNPFNKTILSPRIDLSDKFKITMERLRNRHFISIMQFTPSCKYYISGKGRVPRWSRTNYIIEQLYNEAKNL